MKKTKFKKENHISVAERLINELPLFTFLIVFTELAVFIYHKYFTDLPLVEAVSLSVLAYNPCHRGQLWRFLSHSFIHTGVLHLAFNVIGQLFFGIALERAHGWRRVAEIFATGTLVGSLTQSIYMPQYSFGGSSGANLALVAAYLIHYFTNVLKTVYNLIFVAFFLLLFIGDCVFSVVKMQEIEDAMHVKIGFGEHFFGFLSGIIIGLGILPKRKIVTWCRTIIPCSMFISICILFICGASLFHILHQEYFNVVVLEEEFGVEYCVPK